MTGNDFARNVAMFGVDATSSTRTESCKNNFLVLSEGPTGDIKGRIGAAEKKFSINFSKAKT